MNNTLFPPECQESQNTLAVGAKENNGLPVLPSRNRPRLTDGEHISQQQVSESVSAWSLPWLQMKGPDRPGARAPLCPSQVSPWWGRFFFFFFPEEEWTREILTWSMYINVLVAARFSLKQWNILPWATSSCPHHFLASFNNTTNLVFRYCVVLNGQHCLAVLFFFFSWHISFVILRIWHTDESRRC